MTTAAVKKPPLAGLTRLSDLAKLAVTKPEPVAEGEIAIEKIYVEKQVRQKLGNIDGLVASIVDKGEIHTALWVHEERDGRYRLIAGHRRLHAAPLAGYQKVPVKIYRGLTELQIRALQVSENNDRENLSAFDQAMGVIEDIKVYGMEEARRIWNQRDPKNGDKEMQSEGWMSKRVAVTRYAAPVLDLLQSGACEDFEVLHSLNQLHGLHQAEFDALVAKAAAGDEMLSRDVVRNKVSSVKAWLNSKRTAAPSPAINPESVVAPASLVDGAGDEHRGTGSVTEVEGGDDVGEVEAPGAGQQAVAPAPARQKAPITRASGTERAAEDLARTRSAVIGAGNRIGKAFDEMVVELNNLDLQLSEGEWVLWQSFVAAVGPVAAKLGKARAQAYLGRLSKELKGKDASAAVAGLMTTLGVDKDSPGEMPEGWTF